jgi:hypothetical protein
LNGHSRAVTKHYIPAEHAVDNDDALYDIALKEYNYYENDEVPFGDHPPDKGRMKGDIDVGLVDIENKVLYVKEIKTNYRDLYKAEQQLDRVEDHFEDYGWDVIKNRILEL